MEIETSLKYLRISPKKIRLLAEKLERQPVSKALITLKFVQKRAALPLSKALKTALADAKHNFKHGNQELIIKKIEVSEGPRLKRVNPRSRGIAHPILKRTAHIKITLQD